MLWLLLLVMMIRVDADRSGRCRCRRVDDVDQILLDGRAGRHVIAFVDELANADRIGLGGECRWWCIALGDAGLVLIAVELAAVRWLTFIRHGCT